MSHAAVDWASKQGTAKSSDRLVLWALADHVRKGTKSAWPSVAAICAFTQLSRQTVMDCLARLVDAGLIRDTGGRQGRTRQIIVWELAI